MSSSSSSSSCMRLKLTKTFVIELTKPHFNRLSVAKIVLIVSFVQAQFYLYFPFHQHHHGTNYLNGSNLILFVSLENSLNNSFRASTRNVSSCFLNGAVWCGVLYISDVMASYNNWITRVQWQCMTRVQRNSWKIYNNPTKINDNMFVNNSYLFSFINSSWCWFFYIFILFFCVFQGAFLKFKKIFRLL